MSTNGHWRQNQSRLTAEAAALGILVVSMAWLAQSSRAQPPSGLELSRGVVTAQRRAIWDPWALRYDEKYLGSNPQLEEQVQQAVRLAKQSRLAGQVEVAVDADEDGRAESWIYFANDQPAWFETDRHGSGVHDVRLELRSNLNDEKPRAKEVIDWYREPPVPLSLPAPPTLRFSELFKAQMAAAGDAVVLGVEPQLESLFPGWRDEVGRLPSEEKDSPLAKSFSTYLNRAEPLVKRFQQEFEADPTLARKLRTSFGHVVQYYPHDLDGQPGKEFAVGFSPRGVKRLQFFRRDWLEDERPMADFEVIDGKPARLRLDKQELMRLADRWMVIAPDARGLLATRCLLPAYAAYNEGNWYDSVRQWRRGAWLAAILGDLDVNQAGDIKDDELTSGAEARWSFPVQGLPASSLLKLAVEFGSGKEGDGLLELADDALEARRVANALNLYERYYRICGKGDRGVSQAYALEQMATIHRQLGRYDKALANLFASLDLEGSIGFSMEAAQNLERIATAGDPLGLRRAMAIRTHTRALDRACKLAGIAALSGDLGERSEAEGYLNEAERQFRGLGHRQGEADVLNLRAQWDLQDGQVDLALQRLERSLAIAREQHAQQLQIHEEARARGRADKASVLERQAIHTFRVSETRGYMIVGMAAPSHPLSYQALTASLRGEAYLQKAQGLLSEKQAEARVLLDEARRWQQQALDWYQDAEDDAGAMVSELRLAVLALHRGHLTEAAARASAVEKEASRADMPDVVWRAIALQGAVAGQQNLPEQAITQYERAAKEIESLRTALGSETARQGFFGSRLFVYEQLALLYLRQGKQAEVWECMERSRARTLLDLLAGQTLPVKGKEVAELNSTQPDLVRQLRAVGGPDREGLGAALQPDLLAKLASKPALSELTSLRTVKPAPLADIQAILEPQTTLIAYFLAGEKLLAAVVSRDGLQVISLPALKRAELESEITKFRTALQDPSHSYEGMARKLHDALLEPCLKGRQSGGHLRIVPTGPLHYLPFHALLAPNGRFVIQDHLVSYSASGSSLFHAHRRRLARKADEGGRTIIVAEPAATFELGALPFASIEGDRINALLPRSSVLLKGREATESRIRNELGGARCIHFAGHTQLMPLRPMQTAMLCAPDAHHNGRLEVSELFGLDLSSCEIAVLSACETHRGRLGQGDEIVGLSRAFLRAGVPTVVASLWRVPDEATFRLMVRFHEVRVNSGKPPLEALALAQREYLAHGVQGVRLSGPEVAAITLRKKELEAARGLVIEQPAAAPAPMRAHPYYWAAFAVLGDGG